MSRTRNRVAMSTIQRGRIRWRIERKAGAVGLVGWCFEMQPRMKG